MAPAAAPLCTASGGVLCMWRRHRLQPCSTLQLSQPGDRLRAFQRHRSQQRAGVVQAALEERHGVQTPYLRLCQYVIRPQSACLTCQPYEAPSRCLPYRSMQACTSDHAVGCLSSDSAARTRGSQAAKVHAVDARQRIRAATMLINVTPSAYSGKCCTLSKCGVERSCSFAFQGFLLPCWEMSAAACRVQLTAGCRGYIEAVSRCTEQQCEGP